MKCFLFLWKFPWLVVKTYDLIWLFLQFFKIFFIQFYSMGLGWKDIWDWPLKSRSNTKTTRHVVNLTIFHLKLPTGSILIPEFPSGTGSAYSNINDDNDDCNRCHVWPSYQRLDLMRLFKKLTLVLRLIFQQFSILQDWTELPQHNLSYLHFPYLLY